MATVAEGWWSFRKRRKINFQKLQSRIHLDCPKETRAYVARIRRRNKREGKRYTRAKRVLQICRPWPREKERASNGARKGERSAAGVEEYYRKREKVRESETGRIGVGRQERARKREYQEAEAAA